MALPKPGQSKKTAEHEDTEGESSESPKGDKGGGLKAAPKSGGLGAVPKKSKETEESSKPTGLGAAAPLKSKPKPKAEGGLPVPAKPPKKKSPAPSPPSPDETDEEDFSDFTLEDTEESEGDPLDEVPHFEEGETLSSSAGEDSPESNDPEDDDDFDLDAIIAEWENDADQDEEEEDSEENTDDEEPESSDSDFYPDDTEDQEESSEISDSDDDFDLDEVLAQWENAEFDDSEDDEEDEEERTESNESKSDDEDDISFDEESFSLDDFEDTIEGDDEEDKDSEEDDEDKPQPPLSVAFDKYLSIGSGFVSFLAKLPIIGIPFKMMQANESLNKLASAIIIPALLFLAWFLFNIFYVSGSEDSEVYPDEAQVNASVSLYDSDADAAIIEFDNIGGIATSFRADAKIYSNQIGLNPINWIVPQEVTTCQTGWETIEQGDTVQIAASCEPADAGGFWVRGSVEEIHW